MRLSRLFVVVVIVATLLALALALLSLALGALALALSSLALTLALGVGAVRASHLNGDLLVRVLRVLGEFVLDLVIKYFNSS